VAFSRWKRLDRGHTHAAPDLSDSRQSSFLHQELTRREGVPPYRVTSDRVLQLEDRLVEMERPVPEAADVAFRSRQELTEALAVREQAMGILGHELRNPLSAITALATVTMRRADLPAVVSERLAQIDRAARRSLSVIETLLDFSESRFKGVLSTRLVLAPPADIASRVVEELRAAHPDRLIELDIRSRDAFELDPVRIEQALCNLVMNALVHGDHRAPVQVVIDVGESEAVLSVRNRGAVIPVAGISWLFEPFTQGASADSDQPRGLGLGLYIVRHIVAAHGGFISVESSADQGTTFIVRLPRR
jgi:signal transduction histidine kinase